MPRKLLFWSLAVLLRPVTSLRLNCSSDLLEPFETRVSLESILDTGFPAKFSLHESKVYLPTRAKKRTFGTLQFPNFYVHQLLIEALENQRVDRVGILGLGRKSLLLAALHRQQLIHVRRFKLEITKDSSLGVIEFGKHAQNSGPRTSLCSSSDWCVELLAMQVNHQQVFSSTKNLMFTLNSPFLSFEPSVFEETMNRVTAAYDCERIMNDGQKCNCTQLQLQGFPNITWKTQHQDLLISPSDYILRIQQELTTWCFPQLRPLDQSQENQTQHAVAGIPFFRAYSTVFDLEEERISFIDTSSKAAAVNESNNSSATLLLFVLFLVLVVAVFFCFRQYRRVKFMIPREKASAERKPCLSITPVGAEEVAVDCSDSAIQTGTKMLLHCPNCHILMKPAVESHVVCGTCGKDYLV